MPVTNWDSKGVIDKITKGTSKKLEKSAESGFRSTQDDVPVLTGYLKASGGYAVFGPMGEHIGGMTVDSNGDQIPSPGATGNVVAVQVYNAEYADDVLARPSSGDFLGQGHAATQKTLLNELSRGIDD